MPLTRTRHDMGMDPAHMPYGLGSKAKSNPPTAPARLGLAVLHMLQVSRRSQLMFPHLLRGGCSGGGEHEARDRPIGSRRGRSTNQSIDQFIHPSKHILLIHPPPPSKTRPTHMGQAQSPALNSPGGPRWSSPPPPPPPPPAPRPRPRPLPPPPPSPRPKPPASPPPPPMAGTGGGGIIPPPPPPPPPRPPSISPAGKAGSPPPNTGSPPPRPRPRPRPRPTAEGGRSSESSIARRRGRVCGALS